MYILQSEGLNQIYKKKKKKNYYPLTMIIFRSNSVIQCKLFSSRKFISYIWVGAL